MSATRQPARHLRRKRASSFCLRLKQSRLTLHEASPLTTVRLQLF